MSIDLNMRAWHRFTHLSDSANWIIPHSYLAHAKYPCKFKTVKLSLASK